MKLFVTLLALAVVAVCIQADHLNDRHERSPGRRMQAMRAKFHSAKVWMHSNGRNVANDMKTFVKKDMAAFNKQKAFMAQNMKAAYNNAKQHHYFQAGKNVMNVVKKEGPAAFRGAKNQIKKIVSDARQRGH